MTHCRKESKCGFCPEKIKVATPMVVGKMWMKGGKVKRWTLTLRWHPQCWVKQGLLSLEKRPYSPAGERGRKPLSMSPEDKKERNRILARWASFMFRLREAVDNGETDKVIKIYSAAIKLIDEIEEYGGAPKSWRP